jgi:hypothetical protein
MNKSGQRLPRRRLTSVTSKSSTVIPDIALPSTINLLTSSLSRIFLFLRQHDIYHLFKFNQRCCQCSQDYEFPVTKELLQEDQYIRKCSICHPVQTALLKVERYARIHHVLLQSTFGWITK